MKVILIGDSIRMGYQDAVRRALGARAEVWAPEENGGTSDNVLAHLDEWVIRRSPDLVHVNCGLHDLRRESGSADSFTPLVRYRANVGEILGRISSATDATVIWASSTPVNEEWHHGNKPFDRFEEDVRRFNEAASGIARGLGVRVNDLYSVVTRAGRDCLLQPDGVHFTPEGYELLGGAVSEAITECL